MTWPFTARRAGVRHAALTDVGRRHEKNEDAVLVIVPPDRQEWGFDVAAIVCDGVSGQPRGEVASKISIDVFRSTLSRSDERSLAERLRIAAAAASAAILDFAKREVEGAPVASTVVALALHGHAATIGHVGNSRAYLLRAGELMQITNDHSFVAEQVRQGIILASEARRHPMRSRISRALGTPGADSMDVTDVSAEAGDVFLLCSDGLHDFVEEAEIAKAISGDLERSAHRLIDLANAAGGADNITVALCEVA
ncbi:MAG: serine/threonine-protein phosphatase [Chloroflexota bacterium]|nr:serine/threonine-protein phosphatase [Chloroflexota bacterium]